MRRLAHDWYEGEVPANVIFDGSNFIETSYSFLLFRSRLAAGLTMGHGAAVYANTMFDVGPDGRVGIGDYAMVNGARIVCDAALDIGAYCLISWNVLLFDNYRTPFDLPGRRAYIDAQLGDGAKAQALMQQPQPIRIGSNVWIGHDAVVMPGVQIGEGSVIGARSVVTASVPAYCIAAGNPARVIRSLEPS
jgi:acetyltransferase-like isoleucine patch superfamily enzyme